jgi:hypothetical protein
MELLEEHGVSEQEEGPALRAQAWDVAAAILKANRTKLTALVDQLVKRGRLEASDFLSLMDR